MWALGRFFKEELSKMKLLSFDDIEFFEFSNPYISGIAQPRREIANKCSELILNAIQDKKQITTDTLLDAEIIWR